jgi:hypothetical protein
MAQAERDVAFESGAQKDWQSELRWYLPSFSWLELLDGFWLGECDRDRQWCRGLDSGEGLWPGLELCGRMSDDAISKDFTISVI